MVDESENVVNQIEVGRQTHNLWEMSYEPVEECKHGLPADWIFGGADGIDPRTDPRWQPSTYTYLDRNLRAINTSQVPRCDHEAVGSHRQLIDGRHNEELKTFFIIALHPGADKPVNIYSDMSGMANAAE